MVSLSDHRRSSRRLIAKLTLALGIVSSVVWSLSAPYASAAHLTSRSVVVASASPSVITDHDFGFTYVSASNIGSVAFQYCDSPVFAYPCNAPAGLDVTGATLASQSGNVGFSVDGADTTANRLVLTRPSVAAGAVASQYNFSNIVNPSQGDITVYVRLTTYVTTDGTGAYTDWGAAAFATITPFNVSTSVPPFIRLCAGVTVAVNCSSSSGDRVNLGILTSSAARSGQSQFSAGTNSVTGYNVYILGSTLTSGNNTITALGSPTPSFPGNRQFGINLRANSNPSVGQNPAGPGTATPTASYNIPNLFKLHSGDAIVNDGTPSDFRRMTVSYLANINQSQPPGVYNTTFTYLAVATF